MRSHNRCLVFGLVGAAALVAIGAKAPAVPTTSPYKVMILASDVMGTPHKDAKTINAWGLASLGGNDPFWVNDEGSGFSELIDGTGKVFSALPFVTIPPPMGQSGPGRPTGIVANKTNAFKLPNGKPALFIFDTIDGTISGWNVSEGKNAALIIDNSSKASYTGLAMALDKSGSPLLYAANALGGVDVFDTGFNPVTPAGGFADPNLPASLTPYGVAEVDGNVFVTFAQRFSAHSAVDEFDPDGNLIMRFATDGTLSAPWAVVMAPKNFGSFSNDILIGNFGDGAISAFNPTTGALLGQLTDSSGKVIKIPGLWALTPGAGVMGVKDQNAMYFTAGPNGEKDGQFGMIQAGPTPKPTKTPKPTPTHKPTPTPKPTPTKKPTPTPKPTATPKFSMTPTPTPTPSPTPTDAPTPASASPTPTCGNPYGC